MQQNLKTLEDWRALAASATDFYSPAVEFIDRKITRLGGDAVINCDENHFILMCSHIHANELAKNQRRPAGNNKSVRETLRALCT